LIGDSSDVEDDLGPRQACRAITVLVVGLLGLLGWVSAAAGWVDWSGVGAWLLARMAWIASLMVVLGLIGAGGWSWLRRDRPAVRDRPRVALSWWVVAAALFVVALVAWVATTWLLSEASHAHDVAATRVDAIKTGLSIAAGTGGVFALLLAVRRQWHQELTAQDSAQDATERRVTELYTKAADQLGSDKAPVRLAGLYALERLAQATPGQRQTVVNVLCAYLHERASTIRTPHLGQEVVKLPGLAALDPRGHLGAGEQHRTCLRTVAVANRDLAVRERSHLDTLAFLLAEAAFTPPRTGVAGPGHDAPPTTLLPDHAPDQLEGAFRIERDPLELA
jgi:hypothetical protein